MITLKKSKSLSRIAREWDTIAAVRNEQVCSGRDHSANFVLAPAILRELSNVSSLIDIGCGTGWLTVRAAKHAEITVGIDPSSESIALARMHHNKVGISYFDESVEAYACKDRKFELAISNMAASSAPDLQAFISGARKVLKKNAFFIFTIPHPCFWPLYWGYASHPRFKYEKSFAVEGEFKIQRETSGLLTTHFHHPLEQYITVLSNAGFRVDVIHELTGRGFNLPRFMLIKSQAI